MLWATPLAGGDPVEVFPDLLRRTFTLIDGLCDYRLEQHGAEWRVRLDPSGSRGDVEAAVRAEILELARRLQVRPPALVVEDWRTEPLLGEKRRRIRCVARLVPGETR